MPLIIDAYNVLHVVGVLPPDLAGVDLAGLASLIGRSRFRRQRATLVCDGSPPDAGTPLPEGPVAVRYAGPGVSADDVIAGLIRTSSAPRRLVVVSSDRAGLRGARRRRCTTMTSEAFLAQLATDARTPAARDAARPDSRLTSGQVEDWMRAFEDAAPPPETPALEPAEAEPETGREPAPPPPSPPPAPPPKPPTVLPDSILAEAAALVDEADRADARARAEAEAEAAAAEAEQPEPAPAPPTSPSLGAVLPGDLIEQAEALAAGGDVAPAAPRPTASRTPDAEDDHDAPPPSALIDPSVIAEAEELWRDGDDDDVPGAG
jgi:hypothetical protein